MQTRMQQKIADAYRRIQDASAKTMAADGKTKQYAMSESEQTQLRLYQVRIINGFASRILLRRWEKNDHLPRQAQVNRKEALQNQVVCVFAFCLSCLSVCLSVCVCVSQVETSVLKIHELCHEMASKVGVSSSTLQEHAPIYVPGHNQNCL